MEDAIGIIAYHSVKVNKELINHLKNCKAIVKATIGFDDVDLSYAEEKNIRCANIPGLGVDEVADHTLALILAAQRGLLNFRAAINENHWSWRSAGVLETSKELTLGLIGYGRTGQAVAKRAQAFGYKIIFFDPVNELETFESKKVSALEDIYRQADIISLHLPLTDATKNLIDAQAFALMKPGVIIVNTARGALINTQDLLIHLNNGKVAQACLDVVAEEPNITHELKRHPKIILTPHAAFYSQHSLLELRARAANILIRLINNEVIENLLTHKEAETHVNHTESSRG